MHSEPSSKFPDPGAEGVDAFSRSWGGEVAWVNPRWDDLSRVAHTLRTTPSAAATVVAHGKFPGQPCFQELRAILAPGAARDTGPLVAGLTALH